MNKLRVGVLMGGKSIEREVSFNSGRTICDHLDANRYDIIPLLQTHQGTLYILPWHFLHRGKLSDFLHRLSTQAQEITWDDLPSHIDFMYIAVHGKYAEDGTLQGFLEVLGIPYLGSKVLGSALGMDKIIQKEVLSYHGIQVPKGVTCYPVNKNNVIELCAHLEYPLVVKPAYEGSSLGVSIVHDEHQLEKAIHHAMTIDPHHEQPVLIEEKIEGMEFSCVTITDYHTNRIHPFIPTEVVVDKKQGFFCYEQKYMPGKATEFTPPRCSQEHRIAIQDACVAATRALSFTTMSRIDGFLKPDGTVVIVDPNTLSGMGPSSFIFREAAQDNMSHTHLINHLIETELHAYGMLDAIKRYEQNKAQSSMTTQKKRVAVLFGGQSNEKEISLESGRNILYKLSPYTYEPIALFVNKEFKLFRIDQKILIRNSTHEIESLLDQAVPVKWSELPHIADFVFIGLHGGKGENGAIQGTLEMLGMPYNGSSVLATALCNDKYKSTLFLEHKGFSVPQSMLISKKQYELEPSRVVEDIQKTISFPLIIKPNDDGCSSGVTKVPSCDVLQNALEDLFTTKDVILVQECITGMELTVGVIGNENPQALPPSQTITSGEFLSLQEKFLPGAGENQTPAPLPDQIRARIQETIKNVYQALGCRGYARIDCFYQPEDMSPTKKERIVIIEINTLPGMTPATCLFHQAAEIGLRPMELIDTIIQYGFQAHATYQSKAHLPKSKELSL